MPLDVLRAATFLRGALARFYWPWWSGSKAEQRQAAAQLRRVCDHVAPFAMDPDGQRGALPAAQQQGYRQLVADLGTATHELQKLDCVDQ